MAEYKEKNRKVNSVWSWLKDIISQVDIDEPKVSDLKGVSPEEKASLMLGEGFANEVLVNLNSLYAKPSGGRAKYTGMNQTYIVDNAKLQPNTKNKNIKYINMEREGRVR